MKLRQKLVHQVILSVIFISGCGSPTEEIVVTGKTELLENPYPIGYPSSSPRPNRIIRIVQDDALPILDDKIEKDYVAYKVRDHNGNVGYIIRRGAMERRPIQ